MLLEMTQSLEKVSSVFYTPVSSSVNQGNNDIYLRALFTGIIFKAWQRPGTINVSSS